MSNGSQSSPSLQPDDILMKEYDNVVKQIIHWDSNFWHKSQFFLVIQSAIVVAVLQTLKEQFFKADPMPSTLLWLLIVTVMFNIYLCYVWFRTNRRNREYIRVRTTRARDIEADQRLQGILNTFLSDQNQLPVAHRSAEWETHLPTGFIVIWLTLLLFAIYKYCMFSGV